MNSIGKEFDVPTLMLVAAGLSDKYGVRITVSGKMAFTTVVYDDRTGKRKGMVINIPALDSGVFDTYATLVRGYLDHEVGHVRFTKWEDVPGKDDTRFVHTVANILEDRMVEDKMSACFAGCEYNIRKLNDILFDDAWYNEMTKYNKLTNRVEAYLLTVAIRLTKHRDNARSRLPGVLADELDAIIMSHTYESTLANTELARTINALLFNKLRQTQEAEHKPDGSSQNSKDSSQKPNGSQQKPEGSQQKPDGSSQTPGTLTTQDWNGACDMSLARDQLSSIVGDTSVAPSELTDAATRCWHTIDDRLRSLPAEEREAHSVGHSIHTLRQIYRSAYTLDASAVAEAMQQTTALTAQLASMLKAYADNKCGHRQSGELDTRRIASLTTGNTRVFHNVVRRLKVDTDVMVIVDGSGSMAADNKVETTSKAVYALMRALRAQRGVTSCAYVMYGTYYSPLFERNDPITTKCLIRPNGSTPLGGMLLKMLTHMPSGDRRKVAIVLTDGAADDDVDSIIGLYRKFNIQLAVVGIQDDDCYQHFPKEDCRVVQKLSDLPRAIFDLLQKSIIDKRAGASIK